MLNGDPKSEITASRESSPEMQLKLEPQKRSTLSSREVSVLDVAIRHCTHSLLKEDKHCVRKREYVWSVCVTYLVASHVSAARYLDEVLVALVCPRKCSSVLRDSLEFEALFLVCWSELVSTPPFLSSNADAIK